MECNHDCKSCGENCSSREHTIPKEKLNELGAVLVEDVFQKRYVYDFNPKNPNKWIRLRTNGTKTTLTIKNVETSKIDGTRELEVVVDDFMPDDTIIYGDFKYLGYNLANGIAVESSRDSSFKSGRVDYRGMAIADTQVIVADAFIKLSIAAE